MAHSEIRISLVAATMLVCTQMVRGGDGTPQLSIDPPVCADDATTAPTPRKPLMAALDSFGLASKMDEWNLNVGGYVEGSWTYNFNSPKNQTNVGRVFDFEDQDRTLNQAVIFLERTVDASKGKFDIGFHVEMLWGGDGRIIHSNGLDFYGPGDASNGGQAKPDEQFDLTQAYLTMAVPVGSGLTITAGKFVSFLGYEYINPTLNPFYSHSYMFGYAIPFTNTGIIGKYNLTKDVSITAGVTRGWEQSLKDNNGDTIDFTGQVAWNVNDKLTLTLNGITGQEQAGNGSNIRTVFDLCAAYKATDKLTLGGNGDFGWEPDAGTGGKDAIWYGIAGYLSYKFDSHFTGNVRAEYFNDDDDARGLGTGVYEATLGVAITPFPDSTYASGWLLRPEVRWDHANDSIFNDGRDSDQYTLACDLIYAF